MNDIIVSGTMQAERVNVPLTKREQELYAEYMKILTSKIQVGFAS